MKIPKKITVAGIEYNINELDPECSELMYGGANGDIAYNTQLISLNKNLTQASKDITFIHEVVHAICHALNLNNQTVEIDERFVESFSQILLQVIKQL